MTNPGAADSSSSVPDTKDFSHGLRRAVSVAITTAKTTEAIAAIDASRTVAGSCLRMASVTGMRRRYDYPKSNRASRNRYSAY